MYKFYTRMESIAKAANQNRATATVWPGISWIERALYHSGLDKLPQLINVMAGQMSLVGPRPRVVGDKAESAAVRNLRTVKPGFIGLWTASGPCDPKDETQEELYYVRNWTIWMDLHVLIQTLLFEFLACWLVRRISIRKSAGRIVPTSVSSPGTRANLALSKLADNDTGKQYHR
jgi:lipopolysaccharide/colanic/teichoic acid biosynthesis glycosyltransferase